MPPLKKRSTTSPDVQSSDDQYQLRLLATGSIRITKSRVNENTRECRAGRHLEHVDPTTHFVEARFELGEDAADTLHKGDAAIVVGREHTSSCGPEGSKTYGRVIDAD
ncbi:single-stranded DNA-binding protein [Cryobacterium sp. MP_3.1]|uniref:hypothetical protein n=1 Tax=Cryobacterium sp. MP_3.1 TaxID=3071711 RepID=UPI002E042467|nr:single-stranded DNA-binding protein [Cryobacterium sp. MP_3.1]